MIKIHVSNLKAAGRELLNNTCIRYGPETTGERATKNFYVSEARGDHQPSNSKGKGISWGPERAGGLRGRAEVG